MTVLYYTETGSVYEVDEWNKRARRVTAAPARVQHTLSDGEWHSYNEFQMHGNQLLFKWPPGAPHNYTITTRVVSRGLKHV